MKSALQSILVRDVWGWSIDDCCFGKSNVLVVNDRISVSHSLGILALYVHNVQAPHLKAVTVSHPCTWVLIQGFKALYQKRRNHFGGLGARLVYRDGWTLIPSLYTGVTSKKNQLFSDDARSWLGLSREGGWDSASVPAALTPGKVWEEKIPLHLKKPENSPVCWQDLVTSWLEGKWHVCHVNAL